MKKAKISIPEPRKLNSGNWFIQLRIDGESTSITDSDRKKCIARAMAVKSGLAEQKKKPLKMPLREAVNQYIDIQESVLSPSTIKEYRRFTRSYFQSIMDKDISKLTQIDIQSSVNQESKKYSPKTVKNAHGLLSSTLKMFRPDFRLNTKLPKQVHKDMEIMTLAEARTFINHIKGMDIELPVLLSMQYGLRKSEVTGIKWDCVDLKNNIIKIRNAVVVGENNKLVEKGPKSYAGNRDIIITDYIKSLIESKDRSNTYVIGMNRYSLYRRYKTELRHAGLPSYSFHSLRHLTASVMLAENIPDKYGMEIMGQSTNYTYKHVYQQTMSGERIATNKKLNRAFENALFNENANELANANHKVQ